MRKIHSITVILMMILSLLTFAVSGTTNMQQASGQNNSASTTANQSSHNTSDIVTNNGTLNLSNSTLSLRSQVVNYHGNSQGYLVYPTGTGNNENATTSADGNRLPAVVVIHEWWGLNDNIKNMANELAKEGYVVLAADLYDGQVASTPDEAMRLVGMARNNQNESTANLQAAVRYLSTLENVDPARIASLGWCFGGGQSLQLALNTEPSNPLAATVIYYGNLVTDQQQLSEIRWPVLGIFGGKDQSIPPSEVKEFEMSLNATGIPNEIFIYEGVGHGFANPTGDNFALDETQDSWQKTLEFLDTHLKENE